VSTDARSYRGGVTHAGGPRLLPVACPSGPEVVRSLLPALAAAMAGTGPALVPVPGGSPGTAVRAMALPEEPLERPVGADGSPDPVVLVVPTSGSTGTPRGALLTRSALTASAEATAARVGGPGGWLLCLPTTHVAGLQVLLRSLAAGTTPVCQDLTGGFTAAAFTAAAAGLSGPGRRYTSVVPTQLLRLLDDPSATDALRGFDAVLLGGAATPAPLLHRAREAGVVAVTTYGMSETSGGCVYDGLPLDGVRASLSTERRLQLSGAVLFAGYRLDPAATAAVLSDGVFTTGDLGSVGPDGRVEVLGRADSVLVTGGEKVLPDQVETVLTAQPGVRHAVVVGLDDPEWGQRVVALVVADGVLDTGRVRSAVAERLGSAAMPRHVLAVDRLPELSIGKPDRAAAAALARRLLDTPGAGS